MNISSKQVKTRVPRTHRPRSNSDATRGKAGRPRSHDADSAILGATVELLCEHGFRDLTMEAVAARAGVAKTTVYRRWPTKLSLVIEAVSQTITADLPIPNTGTLSGDIRAVLHEFVEITNRPSGRAILKLLAEGGSDPDLKEALRLRFLEQRTTNLTMMMERGLARGEVRADVDIELAIDMGVATVIHRLVFMEEPLDHEAADHLATLLISAVIAR
ncbi:MAG: TetR/AcrR family transcriptional regulator [Actinobacteria bacterium]|nr:TetR/AcrR family transcriptional regulator [Actinomycetota bacterium]MCL6094897.1 TetR/AcrR family transcriptional regulator [Actinomycetota bacterium]